MQDASLLAYSLIKLLEYFFASWRLKKCHLETEENWKRLLLDFWKFVNRSKPAIKPQQLSCSLQMGFCSHSVSVFRYNLIEYPGPKPSSELKWQPISEFKWQEWKVIFHFRNQISEMNTWASRWGCSFTADQPCLIAIPSRTASAPTHSWPYISRFFSHWFPPLITIFTKLF